MHAELSGPPAMAPPDPASAVIVKSATGSGGQSWVGSPSAVRVGDEIVIAYRLRDPAHRGYAVEIARSADGVRFQTLLSISKEQMDCESLERPALVLTGDGTWRLYLSCATIGTKHWRVELLEAPAPEDFDPASRQVVLPGDSRLAVKDPVVVERAGRWHLWASAHLLDDPATWPVGRTRGQDHGRAIHRRRRHRVLRRPRDGGAELRGEDRARGGRRAGCL